LPEAAESRQGDRLGQENDRPAKKLSFMARDKRPLSPDIQIYRPQLTSVLSISHRVTGIALSVGALLLVSWLLAAAAGPQAYSTVHGFMRSWLGLLLMFGWTFSLFFHLCNGIRHLVWDAGYGFELGAIYASGWTVVAASTVLTVAAWFSSFVVMG
jgi:succinate dehydrogenase / fumarate reductase cytochrome b subunit